MLSLGSTFSHQLLGGRRDGPWLRTKLRWRTLAVRTPDWV